MNAEVNEPAFARDPLDPFAFVSGFRGHGGHTVARVWARVSIALKKECRVQARPSCFFDNEFSLISRGSLLPLAPHPLALCGRLKANSLVCEAARCVIARICPGASAIRAQTPRKSRTHARAMPGDVYSRSGDRTSEACRQLAQPSLRFTTSGTGQIRRPAASVDERISEFVCRLVAFGCPPSVKPQERVSHPSRPRKLRGSGTRAAGLWWFTRWAT